MMRTDLAEYKDGIDEKVRAIEEGKKIAAETLDLQRKELETTNKIYEDIHTKIREFLRSETLMPDVATRLKELFEQRELVKTHKEAIETREATIRRLALKVENLESATAMIETFQTQNTKLQDDVAQLQTEKATITAENLELLTMGNVDAVAAKRELEALQQSLAAAVDELTETFPVDIPREMDVAQLSVSDIKDFKKKLDDVARRASDFVKRVGAHAVLVAGLLTVDPVQPPKSVVAQLTENTKILKKLHTSTEKLAKQFGNATGKIVDNVAVANTGMANIVKELATLEKKAPGGMIRTLATVVDRLAALTELVGLAPQLAIPLDTLESLVGVTDGGEGKSTIVRLTAITKNVKMLTEAMEESRKRVADLSKVLEAEPEGEGADVRTIDVADLSLIRSQTTEILQSFNLAVEDTDTFSSRLGRILDFSRVIREFFAEAYQSLLLTEYKAKFEVSTYVGSMTSLTEEIKRITDFFRAEYASTVFAPLAEKLESDTRKACPWLQDYLKHTKDQLDMYVLHVKLFEEGFGLDSSESLWSTRTDIFTAVVRSIGSVVLKKGALSKDDLAKIVLDNRVSMEGEPEKRTRRRKEICAPDLPNPFSRKKQKTSENKVAEKSPPVTVVEVDDDDDDDRILLEFQLVCVERTT